MSAEIDRPLFVDTGAFYARADDDDANHELAVRTFDRIRRQELPFAPLYSSQFVLGELATLVLTRRNHAEAVRTVDSIRSSDSSFGVLPVSPETVENALDRFEQFDDRPISFVDHTSGVLARRRDIEHVFTFDTDDFETLGLDTVP